MEKLSKLTNALNWFEIPVTDFDRAKKFYEAIFDLTLTPLDMPGFQMAMFPSEPPYVGGALVKGQSHEPGTTGIVVYLNANPDLQLVVDRIVPAGGQVIMPKTLIDEQTGFMAFFIDSEGNSLGLHSNK
ncbi:MULTISPECIES: VOC family protein [unclassified Emticicia]|uniref:VOC family protein n=1 Tax=unclassified Emticicia TaxID=2627301 RepID=UPI000C775BB5|nr:MULTISPECIES: VOC family protein [unclassified Emticicia]PLK43579.1 lactoylglutathione lyase [Emticicia sp. TH156]UTA66176.1 VOC family protein [Emticicia sp. 21SJ11W-3]